MQCFQYKFYSNLIHILYFILILNFQTFSFQIRDSVFTNVESGEEVLVLNHVQDFLVSSKYLKLLKIVKISEKILIFI